EEFLARRLKEEEKKKSHTIFAPWLHKPSPTSPDGATKQSPSSKAPTPSPSVQSLGGQPNSHKGASFQQDESPSPRRLPLKTKAYKAQALSLSLVKECGETLDRFLGNEPHNERTLKEKDEY